MAALQPLHIHLQRWNHQQITALAWWPKGETWPPRSGPGSMAWSSFGRRLAKVAMVAMVWVAAVVALPLLAGLLFALTIGGRASFLIAIVSWLGSAILLGSTLRFGLRTWRPAKSMIETAGRLSDGDYTARAEPSDSALVRQVIDSFNRMAEQLELAERDRRSRKAAGWG